MTAVPRKREVFANPFFVALMAASVVFVLTVLAYLISAVLDADPAKPPRARGSLAMAAWIDRNAPSVRSCRIRDHARNRRDCDGH